jgi:hypothetical protein
MDRGIVSESRLKPEADDVRLNETRVPAVSIYYLQSAIINSSLIPCLSWFLGCNNDASLRSKSGNYHSPEAE